ncbi:rhodanese-like domain-containing protein [Halorussus halophilus]|uniref:rhodanese-like domain-containing protein n=1 Tax=Halorussus halophilus TaxID=2650975 RepID=UPI00130132E6|nr:rhodanese-like domain-containing protein [Halorussus halophilus]
MSKITPSELGDRVASDGPKSNDDDIFVLDVRPEGNYRSRHIEGSYNAPVYHDLRGGDTDSLDDHLSEIPADQTVVTVCKAGVVAKRATNHLESEGYDSVTLSGGMKGWRHYEDDTLVYRMASFVRSLLP